MHSCLYEGILTHCRRQPVTHRFRYGLFMAYLDLEELPSLVGSGMLISAQRHALRSFLRTDHLWHSAKPLDAEVRELVRQRTGGSPVGRIRLLTQLRHFGYYFSPLNLFFVFDDYDRRVEFVVAEVSNTPWNERFTYVLWDGNRTGREDSVLRFSHPKQFHVSPFMDMDLDYRWRLTVPGETLTIGLGNFDESGELFSARMRLRRCKLTRPALRRMTLRFPVMTAQITAAIYYQALKLWWKKCPFHTHPGKQTPLQPTVDSARTAEPHAGP
ncbi:MAG: DUF1365 domain-containing protein [Planctomycetales bacterium]|nr:DUF1365 domain-containing protein [Planctomycetales bacterium]